MGKFVSNGLQLSPAEKQLLQHDLEMDAANELLERKRKILARHQQKVVALPDRFMPKDEHYYQAMVPVIEVFTTEFTPLATAAVEAYEILLENEA
jgi:hypothetical protein